MRGKEREREKLAGGDWFCFPRNTCYTFHCTPHQTEVRDRPDHNFDLPFLFPFQDLWFLQLDSLLCGLPAPCSPKKHDQEGL